MIVPEARLDASRCPWVVAAAQRFEPSLAHVKPRGRAMSMPTVTITSPPTPARNVYPVTREERRRRPIHKNIDATGVLRLITMRTMIRPLIILEMNIQQADHRGLGEHLTRPNLSRLHRSNIRPHQSRHRKRLPRTRVERPFRQAFLIKTGILRKSPYCFLVVPLMPTHSASGYTTGLLPGMAPPHQCQRLQVTSGCC